jgi:hypothetical protein
MKMFSHLWQYLIDIFLEWEMFQIKIVEKTKTHVLRSVTFYENRAIYETVLKYMVETERMQTIRRLCVAY